MPRSRVRSNPSSAPHPTGHGRPMNRGRARARGLACGLDRPDQACDVACGGSRRRRSSIAGETSPSKAGQEYVVLDDQDPPQMEIACRRRLRPRIFAGSNPFSRSGSLSVERTTRRPRPSLRRANERRCPQALTGASALRTIRGGPAGASCGLDGLRDQVGFVRAAQRPDEARPCACLSATGLRI